MKIEVKSKENQRLSMQNEQLQFRLQSQPNLSANNNNDSLLLNITDNHISTPNHEQNQTSPVPKMRVTRASTLNSSFDNNPAINSCPTSSDHDTTSLPVKLRSKSFKTPSLAHNNIISEQFRPVSENFDFNLNDRDLYMTRSVIVYDSSPNHHLHNEYETEFDLVCNNESSCSSNSHLDQNNQSPLSSESCMKNLEDQTLNYGNPTQTIEEKRVQDQLEENSMSNSIMSINEQSIIMLD